MSTVASDFDQVTKGFVKYLERTNQLSRLPELAREQVHLSRTLFDPNLAIVQTVVKLNRSQARELETKLEALLKRPIRVKNRLNQNLLGGMLIRIGDQVIDLSLRSKINSVQESVAQ